ncbi:MAG: NAD(+) synthase [Peptococcaceae bacterium]|jgi:NAD+ synthase (glutamine-hydrolysing)|nr:NAD(+) synthase [Peptococcaceae bacterium]MDH7524486.1 NAD(+) synthase [Peptococcaceae bacterium]
MTSFGFVRAAVASPELRVANPSYNILRIMELMKEAEKRDAALVVFPELSITGYTCGDLFNQRILLDGALLALRELLEKTRDCCILSVVGLPLAIDSRLYNCAAVLLKGRILGVVPKMHPPSYREYYEKRWFSPGYEISRETGEIELLGTRVPFGNLVFRSQKPGFTLGVEICEDLWTPIPPSSFLSLYGAQVIANLSASNELVAKAEYRKQLVSQQSARCVCAYLYANAGVFESTTDMVFSGDCLICENGRVLVAARRFARESRAWFADLDLDVLEHDRRVIKSFADNRSFAAGPIKYRTVDFALDKVLEPLNKGVERKIDKNPFAPGEPSTIDERCSEIFNIQVAGLARRMEHTGSKFAVVGVSGGLDSTLALLVAARTTDLLGISPRSVLAVTMPGFGTTDKTRENALALMKALGVSIREIDIRKACFQHFEDIGHDPGIYDVTYENTQARERMQVLMDLANKVGGLVVGTGDLSELALGWATYNGDHMSMYSVNGGVPKTLVRFLVKWVADNVLTGETRAVLYRVLDTPISPELLPPDEKGDIRQETENLIGPYELHDFFLFYTLRYGMPPQKILFLAEKAYEGTYTPGEIKKWLKVFYQRFFRSQFKRSCLPDGPKVGSVNLSPRGDWRMPSDADGSLWVLGLEEQAEGENIYEKAKEE